MRVASIAQDDTRTTAVGRIKGSDQWVGVVMTIANLRTSGLANQIMQRALFAFAVLAFFVLWVAASMM
jgi:hypothetical protein